MPRKDWKNILKNFCHDQQMWGGGWQFLDFVGGGQFLDFVGEGHNCYEGGQNNLWGSPH